MGTFNASLRSIGDTRGLAATVALEDGRLSIAAGDTEIGSWELKEIQLEPIPTGYRMAAEGDQILIELSDLDSFNAALQEGRKRFQKRRRVRPESATPQSVRGPDPSMARDVAPPPVETHPSEPEGEEAARKARLSAIVARRQPTPAKPAAQPAPPTPRRRPGADLNWVDRVIVAASKRFGAYLPDWVFTRGVFGIVSITLVVMLVFPSLVSMLFLIAGGLGVLLGAVTYSDSVLASRWLPGRTSPQHALLTGLGLLLVGVLLGIIGR